MRAWLINNAFSHPPSFVDATRRFENAFKANNVEYRIMTNTDFINGAFNVPDFVLFRDKDVALMERLEQKTRVFNSSEAVRLSDDKALSFVHLENIVPMPKTIVCPFTFENIGYTDTSFLSEVADRLKFPMVVKARFGSFGEQVFLVNDTDSLVKCVKESTAPLLFQEYIGESRGTDYRLFVVGNEVVAAARRQSENGDFRSNSYLGGKVQAVTPSDEMVRIALLACKNLGLDFGGVDILTGRDSPLLCEVNSNALFNSLEDATGVKIADAIVRHMILSSEK